jgi:glycosyltransferase involved in cell wall biosynthesis
MINPEHPDYTCTPASPYRPTFTYEPGERVGNVEVSVVTPFYNTSALFHDTATSLFRQSFQSWEWLIINDGSTDRASLDLLEYYRNRDPRIRVYDQVNGGPGKARNAGVALARGSLIVFLDSDDLLEPTAIEKWYWFLRCRPDAAFVKSYDVGFGDHNYLWTMGFHSGEKFLEHNCVQPNCMVRAEVHRAIGGFDEAIVDGLEDWDYWLKMANHGFWGDSIHEYLTWYRRSDDHHVRWNNWQKENEFRERLRMSYPRLWEQSFPRLEVFPRPHREPLPQDDGAINDLRKVKRRLLMLIPHMEMGGADKFNLDLIQCMIRDHDYEVTVVATLSAAATWGHLFTALTPDVFILENFLHSRHAWSFVRYLLKSRRPDVICLTNSEFGYHYLPVLRTEFPGVPVFDYLHIEEEYWKSGGYPRYSLDYKDWLDLTVVSSHHLKNWMVERGGYAAQIEVCYTSIEPANWSRESVDADGTRAKWGITPDVPVVLYAGRLCPQKQPHVLAEVLKRLEHLGCTFQALIAGDGPDYAWLEDTLARASLQRARLLGALPSRDIRDLLAVSDLLFLPSKMEGIALILYEAMAMGVVPVGADVGGQRELVTPECGLLVVPGHEEVETYTRWLHELLINPTRRRRMAAAGAQRIRDQFPLRQMGERMHRLMDRLIVDSRRPGFIPPPREVVRDLWRLEATELIQWEKTSHTLWRKVLARDQEFSELRNRHDELQGQAALMANEISLLRGAISLSMARSLGLLFRRLSGCLGLSLICDKKHIEQRTVKIEILYERNPASTGSECRYGGMRHDGSAIFLTNNIEFCGTWRRNEVPGAYLAPSVLCSGLAGNAITMKAIGQSIRLLIYHQPAAGMIRLELGPHQTVHDLYAPEDRRGYQEYTWNHDGWLIRPWGQSA